MKRLIIKYLIIFTLVLFPVENISAHLKAIITEPASFSYKSKIENKSSDVTALNLIWGEKNSKPVNHCEVVETIVIPNPISGNSRIKCLNNYKLQVILYIKTNLALLSTNIIRSSSSNNLSQLLNELQI